MRKTVLSLAILALVAGAAVHAQIGRPIPEKPYDIVVQDDNTRAYLLINSKTGEYEFVRCSDKLEMHGSGVLKISGCDISLADVRENQLVVASINLCTQEGSAAIDVYKVTKDYPSYPPMSERLFDKDMSDSQGECYPDLYNPGSVTESATTSFLIIQNDADGSFLYLDPLTGNYKFVHCEDGTAFGGTATVKIDGCSITFEHIEAARVVVASINLCTMDGKAAIKTIPTAKQLKWGVAGMEEYISDNDLTDNTTQCGPKTGK